MRLLLLRLLMSHPTSHPRGHTIHPSRGACGRGRLLPQLLHDIEGAALKHANSAQAATKMLGH